jgi:hypothetical protein
MSKVITTPQGKAVYPRIDNPDTKFNDDGVYTCKLHVSEADFNAFKLKYDELFERAYKRECDEKGKELRLASASPVRITDEGDFELYAKQVAKRQTSKGLIEFSVAVYDSQGNKMETAPKVGSGSTLRMSVEPSFWFVSSQGFGCTLRLRAVQVIDLVEYGGGSNSESFGFGEVEGGFVAEATDAPVPVTSGDSEDSYDF